MKLAVPSLAIALLASVITACSSSETAASSDAASDAASDASPAFDYCAAEGAWRAGCADSGTTGYDPAKCSLRKACFEGQMRPGVGVALEKCLTTRACVGGDDACFVGAASPFTGLASVNAYGNACGAKLGACASAGGATFSNDYCAPTIASFPDAVIAKLQACFGGACADVTTCFAGVVDAIGCGKSMY